MSKLAERMVEEILSDLSGRKGIGNEWEAIDESIQDEIRQEWGLIIDSHINLAFK